MKSFQLRKGGKYEAQFYRIESEIKSRVDGCRRPRCWILKDDNDDGRIYIRHQATTDDKGRYTYIRRYLFLEAYGFIPVGRRLDMLCGNMRCVNPAHATHIGFRRPYDSVMKMIEMEWVTEEQAREMYRREDEKK